MKFSAEELNQLLFVSLKENKEFMMPIHGTSMNPTFYDGDMICLFKPLKIKRLDVIFYQRENKQYVLHRVLKLKKDYLLVIGDNQTELERISYNQVIAKEIGYVKNNKYKKSNNFGYKLKTFVWSSLLIRKIFFKLFGHK